jgi:hypothetical protein
LGSQLWGLDFHTRSFQDRNLKTFRMWFSGCGISILGPGFHTGGFTWSKTWNLFGEPGDFIVSEGHGHPPVYVVCTYCVCTLYTWYQWNLLVFMGYWYIRIWYFVFEYFYLF